MEKTALATGPDRGLAAVAYLGPLVVIPLLKRKKDRFLFYHTRQGLYLFVVFLAIFLLTFLPVLLMRGTELQDSFLFVLFSVLLLLELASYVIACTVLVFLTMRGRMPMVPVLGEMAGES